MPLLITVPIAVGIVLFFVRTDRYRWWIVTSATVFLIAVSAILAAFDPEGESAGFPVGAHALSLCMTLAEVAVTVFLVRIGLRHGRPLVALLALAQAAFIVGMELRYGKTLEAERPLFADNFSLIMTLIVGGVGGLICLYALGYMRDFHERVHPEIKDRRPLFFGTMFVFLGAMFGIVFCNNLVWLYCFWEITTLCSFLLIGYKQSRESTENAFRALTYNLAGGLAFAVAIVLFHSRTGSIELDRLLASSPEIALAPAALLCFAGLTKAAQFPFASWLLGAMVAPTPVSALLHSSTMVKAGVYLVVRLAPILAGTRVGLLVALIGGLTFLIGSFAAIGTSDAKKVLAYSTIANLGLIVLCGGIGTYEAVWAAILLIVFHAVAKCLLFLCVGIVEHKLHSRDIEAMSGLVLSMPRLSVMLQVGMAGMFLAPFGMIISKWAVLKAVIDAYPILAIFVVFGNAATLFFWVKWMGKLIEVVGPHQNLEKHIGAGEWTALYTLSFATALTCILFPFISTHYIDPYILSVYGRAITMGAGNFTIMTIMLAMVALFPLSFINYGRNVKVVDPYLGGSNTPSSVMFQGSAGQLHPMGMKNYYFADLLPEAGLFRAGVIAGSTLLLALLGLILL